MTMAVLGTVVAMNGEASVIDEKGIKRTLHMGDTLQPGDIIITMPGVVVELELVNGRKIEVTSEQTVKFTQELVDAMLPDSGDSAVDQATVQAVIKAIAEGKDINEVLEETAAGLAGGGGNSYGFSFVDLLRITEGVNPGSYQFDSNGRAVPPVIDPGYQVGGSDDDSGASTEAPPVLSISGPAVVDESAGTITYTVTLSGPSGQTVTVNYSTDNSGTANSPGDFTATTGTLVFAPGVTSLTFTVPINNDLLTEANESFSVNLAAPVNAGIAIPTASTTITDNDAQPVNSVPGIQNGTEDTAIAFSAANGNAITVADTDSTSLTSTLSVTHGTLSLGNVAGVTITGNNSGTLQLIGTAAAINAALDGLNYSPSPNYSGNESLVLHTTDGNLSVDNTIPITLAAVADTPALATSTTTYVDIPNTTLPVSNGLQLGYYQQSSAINKTIAGSITNFETALDGASPTTSSTVTSVSVSSATTGDAYRYTGFVYLEAGHSYNVSGYRDDTLEVKLGGTLVYGVGHNNWGSFTANTYIAPITGYYSLEIGYYNGDGIGSLNLSLSDNGAAPLALNSTNFHLYTSNSVITNSGIDLGAFVPVTDGGYFPIEASDSSSISINSIRTSLSDTDGSESLAVTIGGIPEGAVLSDGTNFFTSAAGATTATVTGWDLHNIFLMPGSTSIANATLNVTSTSTEASNGNAASTSELLLFTVADAHYQSGTASADAITGSIGNDVLVGAGGNDTLSGGNGNDVLIGGVGNDNLVGNAGGDIIWGGTGNDTLAGGNGTLPDIVSDVFVWRLGDQGSAGSPAVDTIADFGTGSKAAGGDILDLKDLLIGESATASSLQDYLHFEVSGSNTIVHISNTGGFSADSHSVGGAYTSAAETQQIVLSGVDVTAMYSGAATDAAIITNLLNNNKLVTD